MLARLKRTIYNLRYPVVGEVWAFHRVTEEESKDEAMRKYFAITPGRLERLIQDHLKKSYRFVSVGQVQKMVQAKKYPYKFIAVTLDDGYADNFENAYPIFKRYNIPFCIFISESFITNRISPYKMLTEEQIIELSKDELCTIGSHTALHLNLSELSIQKQKEQIEGCKIWLEKLLQRPVAHFAYPYGAFTSQTIEVLQSTGIKMACNGWGGGIRKHIKLSLFNIPRVVVSETKKIN